MVSSTFWSNQKLADQELIKKFQLLSNLACIYEVDQQNLHFNKVLTTNVCSKFEAEARANFFDTF